MRIFLKTLGCKANRYESDKLRELLIERRHDVKEFDDGMKIPIDVLVVNTCTVTHVADRKSRQAVYGVKHLYPQCKVIVFGCGSNVSPDEYKKLNGVDFVAKTPDEILEIVGKIVEKFETTKFYSNSDISELKRTRALLKVQDGCNNFCAYCIVPRARGREVSYPVKDILEKAKKLEKEGYKEILLTGINIGKWEGEFSGKTLKFVDLIKLLIDKTKNIRFRISSIVPKDYSLKFCKLFSTGRLCPHLHMSLQSGSDSVLKRMHRNYSTKEFLEICEKFKKAVPDIGLTTDVIVGFPGETEKEFSETCKFVQKIGFLKIHVFPYSKRKNTAAYYMKNQIPEDVKNSRAEILRKISEKISINFKKALLGKTYEVLVENPGGKYYRGFTPNYIPVQFLYTGGRAIVKDFVKIRLVKILNDQTILGEIV